MSRRRDVSVTVPCTSRHQDPKSPYSQPRTTPSVPPRREAEHRCAAAKQIGGPAHSEAPGTPATPKSSAPQPSGAVDLHDPRLCHQPLLRTDQFTLGRDVMETNRPVGFGAAAPAHRHSPVRLRSVVFIELDTHVDSGGCHLDLRSPNAPIRENAVPKGGQRCPTWAARVQSTLRPITVTTRMSMTSPGAWTRASRWDGRWRVDPRGGVIRHFCLRTGLDHLSHNWVSARSCEFPRPLEEALGNRLTWGDRHRTGPTRPPGRSDRSRHAQVMSSSFPPGAKSPQDRSPQDGDPVFPSSRARSHRGPTTSAPRATARRRSSRSAVTRVIF